MMVFQKIYLEIYNLLKSLLVSSIILMIVKSGMEVAPLLLMGRWVKIPIKPNLLQGRGGKQRVLNRFQHGPAAEG
jgi:hypothetical protein